MIDLIIIEEDGEGTVFFDVSDNVPENFKLYGHRNGERLMLLPYKEWEDSFMVNLVQGEWNLRISDDLNRVSEYQKVIVR